jgi:hypothetical protein
MLEAMRNAETYQQWDVATDVPDCPVGGFMVESFEDGRARLTLRYSWVVGNPARDLRITIEEVRALRTLWDGDGELATSPRPTCSGRHSREVWPLLEVVNSRWFTGSDLSLSTEIGSSIEKRPWRHFQVLSPERSIDLMGRGLVSAEWVNEPGITGVGI